MRKRIAIVSSSCPPEGAGGVSSAHYNLYRAIKLRGHEARMFTFGEYNVPSVGPSRPPRRHSALVRKVCFGIDACIFSAGGARDVVVSRFRSHPCRLAL